MSIKFTYQFHDDDDCDDDDDDDDDSFSLMNQCFC